MKCLGKSVEVDDRPPTLKISGRAAWDVDAALFYGKSGEFASCPIYAGNKLKIPMLTSPRDS